MTMLILRKKSWKFLMLCKKTNSMRQLIHYLIFDFVLLLSICSYFHLIEFDSIFVLCEPYCNAIVASLRHAILHPSLFISPQKCFQLHFYTEAIAHALVLFISSKPKTRCCLGDSRILKFIDIIAVQNDEHLDHSLVKVSNVSSAMSHSLSTTSSNSSPSSSNSYRSLWLCSVMSMHFDSSSNCS